ncbi:MAG: IclR family transcriptional regulator [Spirochaetes bacterium]|nr:IclR family transcriptional regulator [Spirochaetota bacterium]
MAYNEMVQSLQRGLMILEIVADAPDGMTLAQLMERTGMKKTTLHNLARTLIAEGFLDQRQDPIRYAVGEKFISIARRQQQSGLRQKLMPFMREMHDAFPSATVSIAEQSGFDIVMTMRLSPERPGIIQQPFEKISHPYGMASSLLFQAFWTDEQRRNYRIVYPFNVFGAHFWNTPEALESYLAKIRSEGYSAPDIIPDSYPVAAPIFGASGEIIATLGIRDSEANRSKLISLAVSCAKRIENENMVQG